MRLFESTSFYAFRAKLRPLTYIELNRATFEVMKDEPDWRAPERLIL
jgi:hypothetical protein